MLKNPERVNSQGFKQAFNLQRVDIAISSSLLNIFLADGADC